MASFYDEMRDVAREMFAEFKQGSVTLVRFVPGVGGVGYAPAEPTEASYLYDGVGKGVSRKYVDGTKIFASDIEIRTNVRSDIVPTLKDVLLLNGIRHQIIQVMNIPTLLGTPIVHIFIARR